MIFRSTTRQTIALLVVLSTALDANAESSNRNDVRANLEKDGWSIVWGKNFTEGDWVRGTKAIAESIAAENPGPFLAWFGETIDENFAKISRNMQNVSRRDLERWIVQSLQQKTVVKYNNLRIEAGFATYHRWERVVYDEPRTGQRKVRAFPGGPWTYVPYVTTVRVEKQVSLPNWHQFYIRYQLVGTANGNAGQSATSSGAVGAASSIVRIDYTIWNDSGRTVRFRLPSGKSYSLARGERGQYVNHGKPGSFKVYIFDTGKEYSIDSGRHKFWWMKNQGTLGFDRDSR